MANFDPAVTTALEAIDAALASLEASTTYARSLAGLAAVRTVVQAVASEPEDMGTPPPPPPPPDDPPEHLGWLLAQFAAAWVRYAGSNPPSVSTERNTTTQKLTGITTY